MSLRNVLLVGFLKLVKTGGARDDCDIKAIYKYISIDFSFRDNGKSSGRRRTAPGQSWRTNHCPGYHRGEP